MYQKLNGILSRFLFDGDFKSLTAIDEGHINTTYFADFTKGKYIIQKIIKNNIYIPMQDTESLNVSVAGGIIMYHLS